MPNHCYQQVTLTGSMDLMRIIYDELRKSVVGENEPELLQLIIPMPFEMNKYFEDENGNFNAEWYDWRVENWGCKWDVAEVEIYDSSWDTDGNVLPEFITGTALPDHSKDDYFVTFNCWTAWGPPIHVWEHLQELGIHVDADYQDEGGMFEGSFVNGVHDQWEPDEGEDIDDDDD